MGPSRARPEKAGQRRRMITRFTTPYPRRVWAIEALPPDGWLLCRLASGVAGHIMLSHVVPWYTSENPEGVTSLDWLIFGLPNFLSHLFETWCYLVVGLKIVTPHQRGKPWLALAREWSDVTANKLVSRLDCVLQVILLFCAMLLGHWVCRTPISLSA